MPITLPPVSRRRFLAGSLAAAASTAVGKRASNATGVSSAPPQPSIGRRHDANRFALLSDLHVAADPATVNRGVNPAGNLRRACAGVTALPTMPAAAIVTGDLAMKSGKPGDYATLAALLRPLGEAGLPVHLGLGNHDHRDRFRQALYGSASSPPGDRRTGPRHVSLIKSPRANLFLLESLNWTNFTRGALGAAQINWLARGLDARRDKPAIVLLHHNPIGWKGISDGPALMDALRPRRQVKAIVFGHTHNWAATHDAGLHLINLPPVAYVFGAGQPNGWVDLQLNDVGATLQLHAISQEHPRHGETLNLAWRAG